MGADRGGVGNPETRRLFPVLYNQSLPEPKVTVVVPTLVADSTLVDCILSLERQTLRDFEVIIVDNSGQQRVRASEVAGRVTAVIENASNAGFGAAINQAAARSLAPYIAVLNDDAIACPGWLKALVDVMESRPDCGMCASEIRLAGDGRLDSAGMLLCGDGSSKQRGHLEPPEKYADAGETLFPSGCAALYRRRMLEEIGGFDESFFLYCEDVDLGLRGRWAGWACIYAPGAMVEHRYSHSAGAASPLKAWLVERNRVLLVLKNFPLRMLLGVPRHAMARYFWHWMAMRRGRGAAGKFRESGSGGAARLLWYVLRSHISALPRLPRLLRERRRIRRTARLSPSDFSRLARRHSIAPRQVATL